MTRRYSLTLKLDSEADNILFIKVDNKTMATLQQMIRLAMADFEKADTITPKVRRRWGKAKQIIPPIEPMNSPNVKEVENA